LTPSDESGAQKVEKNDARDTDFSAWTVRQAGRDPHIDFNRKEITMNTMYMRSYEIIPPMYRFELPRPGKPMNTRTRKTVLKERRRLANAPKSIQKRMLKRM
jgi:hypothetical protein